MTARSLRLAILVAAPVLTAGLSLLALTALNGGGAAKLGPMTLLELSAGYARPAEKLLATPVPSTSEAREAAELSRKALRQFPYDNSSWLRLAYASRLQNGALTDDAVALLRRSYEIAGVDIYAGVWRIGFILENSQSIPRDVRMSAKKEFEALWRDYHKRDELQQMAVAVRNPAGRLSGALWLNAAKASATK
ncbi:hypothetical protein [Phenylobacterium sp.]|uniref:hypothetical protein n=1 Tax=Phenylobacterium sp. TaxID=1871053 RepID=UPI002810A4DD|nr:hypothetical protein [Phenylobacterium sp.]